MILEIRTYRLEPGTGDEFVRVMREESVPLLEESGIRVVDCGASLVAEDGHEEAYLIRAFASLEAHREQAMWTRTRGTRTVHHADRSGGVVIVETVSKRRIR